MQIDVWEFLLDDRNTEKMHQHGVSVRRAHQVLDGSPRALRNNNADGAAVLLVGPDASGEFVTIPIDATPEHGVWRPRTAYPSKPRDVDRYRQLG